MSNTSMQKISLYKKLILSAMSLGIILNITFSQDFTDDLSGPCPTVEACPPTPPAPTATLTLAECEGSNWVETYSDGTTRNRGYDSACVVDTPDNTWYCARTGSQITDTAYNRSWCLNFTTPYPDQTNPRFTCWNNQVVTSLNQCPANNSQVWVTTGYNNYGNNGNSNNNNFTYTNWNTPSGPSYNSVAPTYRPAPNYVQPPVYNAPTQNSGGNFTYTNWNTSTNQSGNNAPASTYRPAPIYQTPVQNNNNDVFVPTNWNNAVNGGGNNAPASVYRKVCQQYFVLQSNNECVQTQKECQSGNVVNINAICLKSCPNSTSQIPENQTCPNQTQTCSNGVVIPVSQTCPQDTKLCANGQRIATSQTCNKTCPNGAVVPEFNTCPNNTKTCKNGNIINTNDECVRICPNGSRVPEIYNCPAASTHRVVTTTPTQVTSKSGRCNGIASISDDINTNGYFEYGVSRSLGNTSNQANIGSDSSVSFSNIISGLKPDTTYYCRAVITNVAGTYRGEIQQFTTKSDVVVYAKPVIQVTKTTKTVTSKVTNKKVEKKIVVCKDTDGNKTDLAEGEKFVTIDISKNDNIIAGKEVNYAINYRNTSDINLKNAYIKVSIPKEYDYVGSVGKVQGSDVLLAIGEIKAGESKEKVFKFRVRDNVNSGQSITSSAYIYYEMLDQDGKDISDENSSYVVGTVLDAERSQQNIAKDNTKVSAESSFSSVFKWISILILFIILVILGKTLYTAYIHKKYKNKILNAHH